MNIIIKRFLFSILPTFFITILMLYLMPHTYIGPLNASNIYEIEFLAGKIICYLVACTLLQCIIWMYYYQIKGIILEQNTFLKIHNIFGIPVLILITAWIAFLSANYYKVFPISTS